MALHRLGIPALCASLLLSGCSTFRSYDNELAQATQHLAAGDVHSALTILESNNTSEKRDILYYMEKGELLRCTGDLHGSLAAWQEADRVVLGWEDAVKADPEKYLSEFGSFLVNDRVRRYEGYDYEKVMLTTQMAVNYAALNDFEQARIEIKKTHEREALIAELRDREYLKRESEAEKQGIQTQLKDLQGYPVAMLDAPEVIGLKNSYQNAFSHYIAGFIYEALSEKGLAAPGYRKAAELLPDTPLLESALENLDTARDENSSEVLLVMQTGLAPARDSVMVPLPIPTPNGLILSPLSFPVIRNDSIGSSVGPVRLTGTPLTFTELASTSAMSRRALRDDMPGIILRTSVRAVTRAIAQDQLNDINPLAGLALGLVSVATEGADERTWRTLPGSTVVARITLPKGTHDLEIDTPQGTAILKLDLTRDHHVVPLRVVGSQVFVGGENVAMEMPQVTPAVAGNF